MESEENVISSEAKLSAIAAVMFFSPFVKNRLQSDSITQEEKSFISWYLKVWFINLFFLAIVLIAGWINFFTFNRFLSRVVTIGSMAVYIISVFSIFACANGLPMRSDNESIITEVQDKWLILKSYIPLANFIVWFQKPDYDKSYRWLKESVLWRTLFIFGTLLFWKTFGIWVLIVMLIRVILLLFNIDIIPVGIKRAINSGFSCNPSEFFAYLFAPIISKIKRYDYEKILEARKSEYAQWQTFWMWILCQYALFLAIMFVLYYWVDISMDNTILFIAMLLWIIRIIAFYLCKGVFLRIPILSEITSLVFH